MSVSVCASAAFDHVIKSRDKVSFFSPPPRTLRRARKICQSPAVTSCQNPQELDTNSEKQSCGRAAV